jgi:hypothetical protein
MGEQMKKHRKKLKFNGKTYTLKKTTYNKEDALGMKDSLEMVGFSVRINKRIGKGFGYPRTPMYGIYLRKK